MSGSLSPTICMKCQILFSGKNKKILSVCLLNLPSMLYKHLSCFVVMHLIRAEDVCFTEVPCSRLKKGKSYFFELEEINKCLNI